MDSRLITTLAFKQSSVDSQPHSFADLHVILFYAYVQIPAVSSKTINMIGYSHMTVNNHIAKSPEFTVLGG